MAYDDIRISELPTLPELHVNDLFLIQDVTNGLSHNIDWNRLKNSIGTLANGIIFPLGNVQEPQIAIGDYTSGIYGDDFGTFNIATHGYKRIGVNQSGTIELVNGNVLVGSYDRQCEYTLIVNNITRFNCLTVVQDDLEVGGDLDVGGDIQGGNNLAVPGDVVLGKDCTNTLTVNSQLLALCDLNVRGYANIGGNIDGGENIKVLHDAHFGSTCADKFDVYSNAHFRCDLRVDGDLSFGGDLLLEGSDIGIGAGCDSTTINLRGNTFVHCNLRVFGDTFLDQNLYVQGNEFLDGNIVVNGDALFGQGCSNHVTVNAGLTVECDTLLRGDVTIGDSPACPGVKLDLKGSLDTQCDILGKQDLRIEHNVELGTTCSDDLLVHSTAVFECDTTMQGELDVAKDVEIGGDLVVNGNNISLGEVGVPCAPYPNQINLHGVVNIDCDLNVVGDIQFGGNLGLGGPLIQLGDGCNTTDIILDGQVTNKCDVRVEGDLTVLGSSIFIQEVRMEAELNVVERTTLDDDLIVNQGVRLNRPVTSQDYWYHCCDIPPGQNCALDDALSGYTTVPITEIFGRTKAYCNVELNDERWYVTNSGNSHVQTTTVYGDYFARSNVTLNSGQSGSSTTNCNQLTAIKGRLIQDCTVILNDTIESSNGMSFNQSPNEEKTIIRGDTRILHNLEVGSGCGELTRINNQFEARCESRLEQNVHLSGGNSGNSRQCGTYTTEIWGNLVQHCSSTLGDGCGDRVTINGQVYMMNGVNLSNGWGEPNVTSGDDGFWKTGGGDCTRASYHHAVTELRSASSQSGTLSDIQITIPSTKNEAGNKTVAGSAGNSQLSINTSGLLTGGNETFRANQSNRDSTITIGITKEIICNALDDHTITGGKGIDVTNGLYTTCQNVNTTVAFNCADAGLQQIQLGNGLTGSYDPCTGGTISAEPPDCSALGLGTLTINGDSWNPCDGDKSITIEGGDGGGGSGECTGTVVINQGGTKKGQFNICGASTTINLDGGGGGSSVNNIVAGDGIQVNPNGNLNNNNVTISTKLCTDSGLEFGTGGCLQLQQDDSACSRLGRIWANSATFRFAGTNSRPGITLGADSTNGGNYLGITGSPNHARIRLVHGTDWNLSADCGGAPGGGPTDLLQVDRDEVGNFAGANCVIGGMGTRNNGKKGNLFYTGNDVTGDPSSFGRVFYLENANFRNSVIKTAADDADVASFDVDTIIDQVAGSGTSSMDASDGIIKFITQNNDPINGEISHWPTKARPHIFVDDVAAIHPSLCIWGWDNDSIEQYEVEESYRIRLKDNPVAVAEDVNFDALTLMSLVGVRRLRSRVQNLENTYATTTYVDNLNISNNEGTTTLEAPVKFEDIVKIDVPSLVNACDDAEAAANGVEVGQVYRHDSQLMVRVS